MAFNNEELLKKNYKTAKEGNVFLSAQLNLLKYNGSLPPRNLYDTSWKITLYNIVITGGMLTYLMFGVLELIAISQYHENISYLIGILCEFLITINICSITFNFCLKRNKLYSIISKVEESFKNQTKDLPFGTKHQKILSNAARISKKLGSTTAIAALTTLPFWTLAPFVLWYLYDGDDIYENNANEENTVHWEFFCFRIWLPQNPYQTPTYQLIYTSQLIPIYFVVTNYISYFTFFYSLTLFATAHFKILVSLIRNVDEYIEHSNIKQNHEESKDIFRMRENTSIENSEEEEVKNQNGSSAQSSETSDEIDYLVKCIKYHQAILEFCDDIQGIYGGIFFIVIGLYGGLLCTTMFQSTLRSEDDDKTFMKFLLISVCLWVPIFVSCYLGEDLTQQGLQVQQAVYETKWYNSTTKYKKYLIFVIMRAQKPVTLSGGNFFPINLEGFGVIANNAYAYFTLLRQTQD